MAATQITKAFLGASLKSAVPVQGKASLLVQRITRILLTCSDRFAWAHMYSAA